MSSSPRGGAQPPSALAGFHYLVIGDDEDSLRGRTQTHCSSADSSPKATNRSMESLPGRTLSNPDSNISDASPTREDLVRHLSMSDSAPSERSVGAKFPELGLSGNVISVNFCVPYKIQHGQGDDWEFLPRKGTSALFDSFTHLSSDESKWNHTLIGWTGEIEQLRPPMKRAISSFDIMPLCKATAPVPVDEKTRAIKPHDPSVATISRSAREALTWKLSQEHGGRVYPVWLPEEVNSDGTNIFRNQEKWKCYGDQTLFPLFHYKHMVPSDGATCNRLWADYEKMNSAFADAVISVYRPGDIVMIHDYHLLLLPRMLRQRLPNIFLGSFLHIPFPSSEYFRMLPKRKQLMDGMLGADMIGFQTDSYAMHFKSSCQRILGLMASEEGVDFDGFHTAFEVFPIGINASATLKSAFHPDVDHRIAALTDGKAYAGTKIIVGRDKLDSARGVSQKLQAFELFLEKYPEWVGKVILVQITAPTSIDKRDEKSGGKLDALVGRINGNLGFLGWQPVHYSARYLSSVEYFTLLRLADVGLITSVRDGMNTTALEYVISQRDKKSPLIISEFSGTACTLENAISINPYDLRGVATAINHALTMSESSKVALHRGQYKVVTENSVQRWTTKCMNRLIANLIANDRYQHNPGLNRTDLLKQYSISKRRLFMFDYDGTLTPIVTDPAAAVPSEHTLRAIETLASDPRNAIWIISGRDQSFLDENLGQIASLGLSAEHGSFMRAPNSTQWDSLTDDMDIIWQEEATDIFKHYSETVHGSYVEQKKIAVTWHYRKADDPTLARHEAQKCQRELNQTVAKNFSVDVMAGKANVEVRPRFVNKGEIVKRLLQAYGEGADCAPDFVLCLGDDSTDEDMFHKLRCSDLPPEHVFAVTVGASSKPTLASSHVPEPEDVIEVIALLNSQSEREGGEDAGPTSEAQ